MRGAQFRIPYTKTKTYSSSPLQAKGKNIYKIELYRVLDIFVRSVEGGVDNLSFLYIISLKK